MKQSSMLCRSNPHRTFVVGLVSGLVALAPACAGSETGNGMKTRTKLPVSIEMRLTAPDAGSERLTLQDADRTSFEITAAYLSVERIEFMLPAGDACEELPGDVHAYSAGCGGNLDRVRIDGPWVVDLVTGEFEPTLEGIDVLDGTFDRIEMKLAPGAAGEAEIGEGDVLDGATLDVSGEVDLADGPSRPFGLTLAMNVQSRFEDGSAVAIGTDADTVQLSLDIGNWFETLTLGTCIAGGGVPSSEGVLRLEDADRRACGDVSLALRQALSLTGKAKVKSKKHEDERHDD